MKLAVINDELGRAPGPWTPLFGTPTALHDLADEIHRIAYAGPRVDGMTLLIHDASSRPSTFAGLSIGVISDEEFSELQSSAIRSATEGRKSWQPTG